MTETTPKRRRKQPGAGAAPGPKTPAARAPAKKYTIDIYRAWCKECGLCASFCPKGCIELDETGKPFIAHPERCIGCRFCELHCPDFAINVRECDLEKPKEEAE